MFLFKQIDRPEYAKLIVERKKGLQQILLIPMTMPVHDPVLQIIPWRKNVMHVYQHARFQGRQDLEEFKKHISLWTYDMRGVDEQDVAGLQLAEDREGQVLHLAPQHFHPQFFQPGHFIRLDADMRTGASAIFRAILPLGLRRY